MTANHLLHYVLDLDKKLMVLINVDLSNEYTDYLALFLREALFHIPLYVFMIFFVLVNFGKKGLVWLMYAVMLIIFSDVVSSHMIKPFFGRIRPCNDPSIMWNIKILAKYCGANGSFTSSHATNHFAFATFVYYSFKSTSKYFSLMFIWATLISISQIYAGVHYPFDVLCGAILGYGMGWLLYKISRQPLSLQHNYE